MNSVGIRLVGGPADGKLLVIQGDPANPPRVYDGLLYEMGRRRLIYRRADGRGALGRRTPGADGPPWRYLYDGDRPVTSVEPSAADTDLEERTLIMGHQLRYMVSGPVDPGAWSRGEVRFSSARRAPGDQDAEVDVEATWDRSVTGIPILTVTAWDLAVALAEHTRQGADGPPDQVADSDPRSAP